MPARTANKVKVYVRTRPTNEFAADMISIGRDNRVNSIETKSFRFSFFLFRFIHRFSSSICLKTIDIHRPVSANVVDNKVNDWTFHLDGVFHNVSQEEIFNSVAKDVIDRALDGYNGQ